MRIEYTIDELVLIGFDGADRDLVAESVSTHLAGRAVDSARPGARSADAVGRAVAAAVADRVGTSSAMPRATPPSHR